MKLSAEQIQIIEHKVFHEYGFYYDDSKHEVIDHIASEIEERMNTEPFENACNKVFELWKPRLQPTDWNGMHIYGKIKMPMFYKKQLNQSFKNDLVLLALLSLVFPSLVYIFKDKMEINFISNLVLVYKIIVFGTVIFLNKYVSKKYENDEYTTIYGQIASFANQKAIKGLALVAFACIVMQQSSFKSKEIIEWSVATLVWFNAFYFLFILKYCNYFRHLKMVKKIKKWNIA